MTNKKQYPFLKDKLFLPIPTVAWVALFTVLTLGVAFPAHAEDDARRFDSAIAAFEKEDAANPPPDSPYLMFLGSSSIRMWDTLADDMTGWTVTNRGFGGSQISDILFHYDRIFATQRPLHIVFYCGENDISVGKTPERVLEDFKKFVVRAKKLLPKAPVTGKIFFVSMKPSPKRWAIWSDLDRGNRLIADYCKTDPRLVFMDIGVAMIGKDGAPLPDIWKADKLHMNAKGYSLWTPVILKHLKEDG